jgi:hypothetical protein
MHISEFNEAVTAETVEYITQGFMQRFWSKTGTYTQQTRTSALPAKMLRFIQDGLKAKGEWLSYGSDPEVCND